MSSGALLYLQAAEALRAQFSALPAGTLVPAEPVLQAELDVSRATLRRALEILEREGLIERQRGRGTFTRQRRLVHNLSGLSSWTEQLRATGAQAGTQGLKVTFELPPPPVVELGLPSHEEVLVVDRVRLADGVPISWMRNYLPRDLVKGLRIADLEVGSLYEALRRLGIQFVRAEDVVTADLCDAMASERLGISLGDPVLCTARCSFDGDGRVAEVGRVVSVAHRYEYRVQLEGRAPAPLTDSPESLG